MVVSARKMPADWEPKPAASADPFRYGWRPKYVHLPNGDFIEQQIPLTLEDLLDPQLGDVTPQGGEHFDYLLLMINLLRDHYESRQDVYVAGDMKMLWGIPGLPGPAPDVAVIQGYRPRETPPEYFDVVQEGGSRPCLIIEVASPHDPEVRRNDYEAKVEIYQRAGIPEYVILDSSRSSTKDRLLLTGYRLGVGGRYQRIEPDGEGFLLSETTQLRFGVAQGGKSLVIVDTATGERLPTVTDLKRELQEAIEGRRVAEKRIALEAENARLRAELDRLRKGTG